MHRYGECRIEAGEIIHRKGRACAAIPARDWRIPIADVRLIAEVTTPGGPVFDYFYIFIVGNPPRMYQVPMEALEPVGFENFFRQLETNLESPLPCHLANSADFASSILWPQQMDGQPLFDFPITPQSGIIGKLIDRMAPSVSWAIADHAIRFLDSMPTWAD